MTYKPIDRSFSEKYLQTQHGAMRWLFRNGLTIREIQNFSLGNVDESSREIKIVRSESCAKYYSGLGRAFVDHWDNELRLGIIGSGFEYFFLKQSFISSYMFTREKPKSWRKKIAVNSLYSLSQIRYICSEDQIVSRNVLTFGPGFGTMKVSKLNITKLKATGQEE